MTSSTFIVSHGFLAWVGGAAASGFAVGGALGLGSVVAACGCLSTHLAATCATAVATAGVRVAAAWVCSRRTATQSRACTKPSALRRLSSTTRASAALNASLVLFQYTESGPTDLSCFCASRRLPSRSASWSLDAAASAAFSFTALMRYSSALSLLALSLAPRLASSLAQSRRPCQSLLTSSSAHAAALALKSSALD